MYVTGKTTNTGLTCAEQLFMIAELKDFAKVTKQTHLERKKKMQCHKQM